MDRFTAGTPGHRGGEADAPVQPAHNRIDSTERCVWSSIDVGFSYGHTRCPNDCQGSTVIEDRAGDPPTPMVTVRRITTTVETHIARLPASAYRIATDLIPAGQGGAVPASVDLLLARHETIDTAQEGHLEHTRRDLRMAGHVPRRQDGEAASAL